MLVLKKISTKKLVIYIFIILLMIGGTVFSLYQNQGSTNNKSLIFDNPAQPGDFMTAGVIVPGGQAAPGRSLVSPLKTGAESGQPLQASKIKNNKGIDLTIFFSEKFKGLEKNIIVNQENSGLGKRDLFKPN